MKNKKKRQDATHKVKLVFFEVMQRKNKNVWIDKRIEKTYNGGKL